MAFCQALIFQALISDLCLALCHQGISDTRIRTYHQVSLPIFRAFQLAKALHNFSLLYLLNLAANFY